MTLLYIIIYEKCIIFGIAFGEMHELLIWKNEQLYLIFDKEILEFMVY